MRILLIHQAFVSPDEAGGTRHFELARRLVERGHDVTIIASSLSYLSGERRDGPKTEVYDGVEVIRVWTYSGLHTSFLHRIVSFVSFMSSAFLRGLFVKNIDIVWGTSPPIFQAVAAGILASVRRKIFLLEVRDLWPEFAIDMGVISNPVAIWGGRLMERFLYWKADKIVVNSPAYRDYLMQRGIQGETVSVVSNGVDTSMFDPKENGNWIRDKYDLQSSFVVTYAGAIGLANDLSTLLDAAALLADTKEIHILIVGDGKERRNLIELSRLQGLKNVTWVGAVPKSAVGEYLGASDACLAILMDIPMFKTTYPNKVFDYMAAGRPTLLAIDGVIREVIEDAEGGVFVKPGDSKALAAEILALSRDRELVAKMGRQARKYVTEHFERSKQCDVFHSLLESLKN